MTKDEFKRYLAVIKRAVELLEVGIENDDGGVFEQLLSETTMPVIEAAQPVQAQPVQKPQSVETEDAAAFAARQEHIKNLMDIDCWPEAVPEHLVASSTDEDQVKRAKAVMDMMVDRCMEDMNFLDFGCGEGWITNEALKRGAALATGYDITINDKWDKFKSGPQFTSVYNEVPKNNYDIVFLFDVLDHCSDPEDVMKKVQECLKKDGVIYARCHPWTSKHANHLFKQGLNKAYLHLFLNWDELNSLLGESPMFTRTESNSLEAYHWWFDNFNIDRERLHEEPVSDFFHVAAFKELLAAEQQVDLGEIDGFLKRMEVQFADYVLTPK